MNKQYILILGSTSEIAQALARIYAQKGYSLYLTARNVSQIADFANDLQLRYDVEVRCFTLDILQYSTHTSFYKQLPQRPHGVISVIGYLGEAQSLITVAGQPSQTKNNEAERLNILAVNYSALVNLLEIIAFDFEKHKIGFFVVISSVAGDRGRRANYLYGSAKAGLATYLSGLRSRLQSVGIAVLTVKPGFVATKMTKDMNLPKLLVVPPKKAAQDIWRAQVSRKDILYTPWFWRYIMSIICYIPERIFKRLNI